MYTTQAVSKPLLRNGFIRLSGTNIEFPTQVAPSRICQVRVVPKCDSYVIEVIYEPAVAPHVVELEAVAAIDLGLDNLAALTSNQKGFVPLLINGRALKSINQFYNKVRLVLEGIHSSR